MIFTSMQSAIRTDSQSYAFQINTRHDDYNPSEKISYLVHFRMKMLIWTPTTSYRRRMKTPSYRNNVAMAGYVGIKTSTLLAASINCVYSFCLPSVRHALHRLFLGRDRFPWMVISRTFHRRQKRPYSWER